MKTFSLVLTLCMTLSNAIQPDQNCLGDSTGCEYNLYCANPMKEIDNPSNERALCVNYYSCHGAKLDYTVTQASD